MKFLFIFLSLIVSTLLFSQAPQKMSFQAVIRNSNDSLLISTSVGMRISLVQSSPTGTVVFSETQTATTNANGLVSLQIGTGTAVSGTFAGIDWAAGPYYVKTETDLNGGTNYTIISSNELLSVPYALFSANGTPGATGSQGPIGLTGAVGATGPAGATGSQGPIGLTGAVGATGPAGATGPQGPQGITGTNGNDGATGPQGLNGLTALVKTTAELAGANCATGGTKIETGLDANNNGVLDIAEVNAAQTTFVCNGGIGTNSGNGIYSGNSIISNDTVSPLMRYIGNGQEGAFDCTTFFGELSGEHFYTNFKVSSNCTLQIGKAQTTIIHVKDTCFINGVINGNGGVVTRYTEDRTNFIGATGDYSGCSGGGQSGYYYTYNWSFSPEGLSQLIGHNHIKSTGARWANNGMSLNDIRTASFLGTRIHGCTSNMMNCGNMAQGGSGLVIICKVLVFSGQIDLNGTQGNAGASGGGSLIISADNISSNIGSFSSNSGFSNGAGGQGIKYIINY